MEGVFLWLFNRSITAAWMVLAVMLVRLLLKRAPKSIRPVLWGLVGLRLLLPVSVESLFSLIPSAQTVPPAMLYADAPTIDSGIPLLDRVVNPARSGALASRPENSVNPLQALTTAAAWLWAAGVAALLVYGAVSMLLVRRRVREAARDPEGVWLCDGLSTPFICGIFRPRIYLPSALPREDRVYVLAHENAHLRRRDQLWKPLGFLLLTVYWFNPLLWVAYGLLCRDMELACDEQVIRQWGEDSKTPYAQALIRCSSPRRLTPCPLAFGQGNVKERVKTVLQYKKPAFWLVVCGVAACVVTAVCLLTNPPSPALAKGETPSDEASAPAAITTAPPTTTAPPATTTTTAASGETEVRFLATVLEKEGDFLLLVEPREDSNERRSSDKIQLNIPADYDGPALTAGMTVAITYDGLIMETYPAQLHKVFSLTVPSEND